jgi:hypothetical protein
MRGVIHSRGLFVPYDLDSWADRFQFANITMTDFETTVGIYRGDAVSSFNDAHHEVELGLPSPPPNLSPPLEPAEQKKLDAAKAKLSAAEAKVSASVKQLDYTEQLLSTQVGRDGYKAVVKLMNATADTAAVVCTEISGLVGTIATPPTADQQALIDTLTRVLDSLARLSPMAVWEDRSPPSSPGA